jgi:uncharacterized phage protein (TIGR01671 family)
MGDRFKFRAKGRTDGKWYYGYYVERDGCDYGMIYEPGGLEHKVDKTTVGQCTDLEDKNGKLIHVGDIVKVHKFETELGENLGVREGERKFLASIHFSIWGGISLEANGYDSGPFWGYEECGFHDESFEIVGNIYENPELLKQADSNT